MRLDIGIASYGKDHARLRCTINALIANSRTEWRCFIVHNPSEGDEPTRSVIRETASSDNRFMPFWRHQNGFYAAAVNELFRCASTDYIGYLDNDATVLTPGWDLQMCEMLDSYAEVGQVYPGSGHYGFFNGRYHECLWNAGYCFMVRAEALRKVADGDRRYGRCTFPGMMDELLGHHNEVDLMTRLRMAGYQIGCLPNVDVRHEETATKANPADHQPGGRIHDGVVAWMAKWNRYFLGDAIAYSMTAYDPKALRYTDWCPDALFLERMTLANFPQMNANPREVYVPGVGNMDAIEVLKPTGCYRGRAI